MKKRLMIIMLSVMLLLPITAKAETKLSLDCGNATVAPGGSLTCKYYVSGINNISGVRTSFDFSGDISLGKLTRSDAWQGGSVTENVIFSDNGTSDIDATNNVEIGSVTINASSSASEGSQGVIKAHDITITKNSASEEENPDNFDTNITISSSASNGNNDGQSGGSTTTNSSNPKTMDTNVVIITLIVALAAGVVIVGKKKLDKISK